MVVGPHLDPGERAARAAEDVESARALLVHEGEVVDEAQNLDPFRFLGRNDGSVPAAAARAAPAGFAFPSSRACREAGATFASESVTAGPPS